MSSLITGITFFILRKLNKKIMHFSWENGKTRKQSCRDEN